MQPRALRLLLKECQEASTSTISRSHSKIQRKLRVSIMEIYLDRVRDLLDNNHGTTQEKKLEVRQDQAKGNFVPGLTSKEVKASIMNLPPLFLPYRVRLVRPCIVLISSR